MSYRYHTNPVMTVRESQNWTPLNISHMSHRLSMRLTKLDLNKIKEAAKYRAATIEKNEEKFATPTKTQNENLFGEDVKIVRNITLKHVRLTENEKEEVELKYESGMTMMALADLYGCHYTTIGRLLRTKGIAIRE